jgi:hypothetical protein
MVASYEQACSDIDNMNAFVDSIRSGRKPVVLTIPERDPSWILYPSDSLGVLSRTVAGFYGSVSGASLIDNSPLHLYSLLLYQSSQFASTNDSQ